MVCHCVLLRAKKEWLAQTDAGDIYVTYECVCHLVVTQAYSYDKLDMKWNEAKPLG